MGFQRHLVLALSLDEVRQIPSDVEFGTVVGALN